MCRSFIMCTLKVSIPKVYCDTLTMVLWYANLRWYRTALSCSAWINFYVMYTNISLCSTRSLTLCKLQYTLTHFFIFKINFGFKGIIIKSIFCNYCPVKVEARKLREMFIYLCHNIKKSMSHTQVVNTGELGSPWPLHNPFILMVCNIKILSHGIPICCKSLMAKVGFRQHAYGWKFLW